MRRKRCPLRKRLKRVAGLVAVIEASTRLTVTSLIPVTLPCTSPTVQHQIDHVPLFPEKNLKTEGCHRHVQTLTREREPFRARTTRKDQHCQQSPCCLQTLRRFKFAHVGLVSDINENYAEGKWDVVLPSVFARSKSALGIALLLARVRLFGLGG